MKRPGFDTALKLLAEIEKPILVDVGAYVGKIERLCKEVRPDVISYALEPDITNYNILKSVYKDDPNTKCYNAAISFENGKSIFYVVNRKTLAGSSESNTLFKKVLKDKKKHHKDIGDIIEYEVDTFTMDTFVFNIAKIDRIDLLKLNCEGGEYYIFEKEQRFLDITKMIYVSFHAQNSPFNKPKYEEKRELAFNMLKSHGFKFIDGLDKKTNKKHICQLWSKI